MMFNIAMVATTGMFSHAYACCVLHVTCVTSKRSGSLALGQHSHQHLVATMHSAPHAGLLLRCKLLLQAPYGLFSRLTKGQLKPAAVKGQLEQGLWRRQVKLLHQPSPNGTAMMGIPGTSDSK